MIKIQNYSDLESEFFDGRDFGNSLDVVRDVLFDVKSRGDAALSDYAVKFDVASPISFEIPRDELEFAAQKMNKAA